MNNSKVQTGTYILALAITVSIFLTLVLVGNALGDKRQQTIGEETQKTYNSLAEMQTFSLMSDTYGTRMACLAFSSKLQDLDSSLWNLGIKLDQYREASEEFRKSEFYEDQKRSFNENQILYLMLLRKLEKECDYEQVVVLFFYKNADKCTKCDDQSFVLTDVNRDFDDYISVFSFDSDLNLTTINLLEKYYSIDQYPCTVIEDEVYCGIHDKDFVIERICENEPSIPLCSETKNERTKTIA